MKLSQRGVVIPKRPLKTPVQPPLCELTHHGGDKITLTSERAVPTGCFSPAALVASFPCHQALQPSGSSSSVGAV